MTLASSSRVTLELGGKSPVIVHPSYPVQKAADRILTGKLYNAGQTCLAPDYALVHRDCVDDFVAAARRAIARNYPSLAGNAGDLGPQYAWQGASVAPDGGTYAYFGPLQSALMAPFIAVAKRSAYCVISEYLVSLHAPTSGRYNPSSISPPEVIVNLQRQAG